MTASFTYRDDVRTQSSVCGLGIIPAFGCALLLSHVNQINMTREKRVSWFV